MKGSILQPVEAERGQLLHVAAVHLSQGVRPEGGRLHQSLVPAGGAPGLQLLLNTTQDLSVVRRGDLSATTPVHLQGATRRRVTRPPGQPGPAWVGDPGSGLAVM